MEAYPLNWPAGFPRSKTPQRSQFAPVAFAIARDELLAELRRLGARDVVLSSNIPLRKDGYPTADFERRRIHDHGVAVYFRRNGKPQVLACDRWDRVEHNLRALARSIEALRGLTRWGASDILERAFLGMTALPAPEQWWSALGVGENASLAEIEAAFRSRMKQAHPDVGGSEGQAAKLNWAIAEARRARGASA